MNYISVSFNHFNHLYSDKIHRRVLKHASNIYTGTLDNYVVRGTSLKTL